jgi:hypothetical protein
MRFESGDLRSATQLVGWVALIALAGCRGGGTIQATGNADQAKQAVQLTLDAWKSGTSLVEFTTAHPELVVADEDWQAGSVLAGYKIQELAVLNGSHWRQKTELQLKGKSKSKPSVAVYDVTLGEKTVILRSDFQY